jgi:hypothetical protein
VHLVFADEDTATPIARLTHPIGCSISMIDRMDVSGAGEIFDNAERAAIVLDAERNGREVALETATARCVRGSSRRPSRRVTLVA